MFIDLYIIALNVYHFHPILQNIFAHPLWLSVTVWGVGEGRTAVKRNCGKVVKYVYRLRRAFYYQWLSTQKEEWGYVQGRTEELKRGGGEIRKMVLQPQRGHCAGMGSFPWVKKSTLLDAFSGHFFFIFFAVSMSWRMLRWRLFKWILVLVAPTFAYICFV